MNPSKYKEDERKVMFMSTKLKGSAFTWFEPIITDYLDCSKKN